MEAISSTSVSPRFSFPSSTGTCGFIPHVDEVVAGQPRRLHHHRRSEGEEDDDDEEEPAGFVSSESDGGSQDLNISTTASRSPLPSHQDSDASQDTDQDIELTVS